MQCHVLLFAQARELVGSERLSLTLPERATVARALDELMRQHPQLETLRNRLAVAVDERYAPPETRLREDSVVALIPPVSGG